MLTKPSGCPKGGGHEWVKTWKLGVWQVWLCLKCWLKTTRHETDGAPPP